MTPEDLLAQLELDIEWRSGELNALFRELTDDGSALMRARRRSTVPMLQAHAEGFVRFALRAYLRHINSQGRQGSEVQDIHLVWSLSKEFGRLRMVSVDEDFASLGVNDNRRVKALYSEAKFISSLDRLVEATIQLDESPLDRFDQNLDGQYLLSLFFQCGLDLAPHRSYSEKLNGLVIRRNEVAHGEDSAARMNELVRWRSVIFELFRIVRDSVYAAAIQRHYLRPTT